jgi:pantetheine-phosphate adenylyltransferase
MSASASLVFPMKRAVYAGTFDPVTFGHLSVLERCSRLFDRTWLVIAANPGKEPLFSAEERAALAAEVTSAWPNVEVVSTTGFVVELAQKLGAQYLVRGVRGVTDAESELSLASLNRKLAPEIETLFVPAHPELSQVSSSRLKELLLQGADISRYCPARVAECLRERLLGRSREEAHV